jgi:flavin reductase (DIM6/NTAB) family NADH-FMN oxidoreductase RutF
MDHFSNISPEQITDNVFKLIGQDWMLVTAGKPDNYNMMTAAWGCAGILWKKPVAIAFIRPQRHTYSYMEEQASFTLNFFDDKHKDLLTLCGTKSGRDIDKMNIAGLETIQTPSGNVVFQQARMALECVKIYYDDIKPEFFQTFEIEKVYPEKDYHRFYIGEIRQVWIKNHKM